MAGISSDYKSLKNEFNNFIFCFRQDMPPLLAHNDNTKFRRDRRDKKKEKLKAEPEAAPKGDQGAVQRVSLGLVLSVSCALAQRHLLCRVPLGRPDAQVLGRRGALRTAERQGLSQV